MEILSWHYKPISAGHVLKQTNSVLVVKFITKKKHMQ